MLINDCCFVLFRLLLSQNGISSLRDANNTNFLLSVCLESLFAYFNLFLSHYIAWFSHCHPWRTSASIRIKFHHKTCHRLDLRPRRWKPLLARYSRNTQKADSFSETAACVACIDGRKTRAIRRKIILRHYRAGSCNRGLAKPVSREGFSGFSGRWAERSSWYVELAEQLFFSQISANWNGF